MEKIKRFFECYIPVTVCNLECSYCYVIQEDRRTMELPKFKYSPENIGQALSVERLGGCCYFSICGGGETLAPKEMPEILYHILKQGHYVNVTTNGTLTKRFKQIILLDPDLLSRLHFAFSFHYTELLKTGNLNRFFDNIKLIKEYGCSYMTQLNLCDEYEPHLKTIKDVFLHELGELPQIVATRNELTKKITLHTEHNRKDYVAMAKPFSSKLFDFTINNFMVKRKEFCYAGDWSAVLNLSTGILKKCYHHRRGTNIFNEPNRPIPFEATGFCGARYCFNSSHFMSLGIIPDIQTPSYQELRDNGGYTARMKRFLNGKLAESNKEYSSVRKLWIQSKYWFTSPYWLFPKIAAILGIRRDTIRRVFGIIHHSSHRTMAVVMAYVEALIYSWYFSEDRKHVYITL